MTKDSLLLGDIINELFADMAELNAIWVGVRELNPHLEQASEDICRGKEAFIWLHGETNALEASPLEEWLFATPPTSQASVSPAVTHFRDWCARIDDGIHLDFLKAIFPNLRQVRS